MVAWEIRGCTVADAAALARNNISAFWDDPTWIQLWPEQVAQEFLIEQSTKRYPRNLLRDRATTRHQKTVNPVTGALVGYARWILPEGHSAAENGEPAWPEAQVPAVSGEEEGQVPAAGRICVVGAKQRHGRLGRQERRRHEPYPGRKAIHQ